MSWSGQKPLKAARRRVAKPVKNAEGYQQLRSATLGARDIRELYGATSIFNHKIGIAHHARFIVIERSGYDAFNKSLRRILSRPSRARARLAPPVYEIPVIGGPSPRVWAGYTR